MFAMVCDRAKVVRANPIGNGYISAVYTRMEPEVILEQQNLVDPNFFFGEGFVLFSIAYTSRSYCSLYALSSGDFFDSLFKN